MVARAAATKFLVIDNDIGEPLLSEAPHDPLLLLPARCESPYLMLNPNKTL
jgi:hypothetical protein